jgi:hypothetical protein
MMMMMIMSADCTSGMEQGELRKVTRASPSWLKYHVLNLQTAYDIMHEKTYG